MNALEQYVYRGALCGYSVSNAELDHIISLYDHYDQTSGAPSILLKAGDLPPPLKSAIHNSYSLLNEGRKLSHIRASLLRGIDQCPVCGISFPGELDHYLPKSAYQAMSIYVCNLIPHCHECNHLKSAAVGVNPARHFVHAYFDILPNVQFLNANITLAGHGLDVEFSIGSPPQLSALMRERLINQFEKLKLNARYSRELNTFITGQASGISLAYSGDQGVGVQDYLTRQAAVETGVFHLNHWRPVLFRALANHWEFCNGGFANVLPHPP